MLHDPIHDRTSRPLRSLIGENAAARDADGHFPSAAFNVLFDRGDLGSPPLDPGYILALLRLLSEVGRGDLSVGRIFEGHVNALLLVRSHGTPGQIAHYQGIAAGGGVLGVWNTDAPDDPLRLDRDVLIGRKNYASGVDGLSHAIVTIPSAEGRRMIIVPLQGLDVDRSWWRPMGMRASGSHVVTFTGTRIQSSWVLGVPNAYVREPWFSAGAIRFAAVQTGGMHAVFDAVREHLQRLNRLGDPHQAHRLARMGIAVESAYGWLDRAGEAWIAASHSGASAITADRAIAVANATRMAVESASMSVVDDAERAVGAAGFIAPHPLERLVRDLRTYLRQPNPDGALASLGVAIANGTWSPGER